MDESNKNINDNIKNTITIMKEDYENEWWRPSKIDDYDLKKKVNKFLKSYLELDVDLCKENITSVYLIKK